VFFYYTALKFIQGGVGKEIPFSLWKPALSTNLIILGIVLGWIIFKLSNNKIRLSSSYIGGEVLEDEVKVEDFYVNIRDMGFFKKIYLKAEHRFFDIYEQGKRIISSVTKFLSYLHNGVLPTYLVWCLLGVMGLFLIFLR